MQNTKSRIPACCTVQKLSNSHQGSRGASSAIGLHAHAQKQSVSLLSTRCSPCAYADAPPARHGQAPALICRPVRNHLPLLPPPPSLLPCTAHAHPAPAPTLSGPRIYPGARDRLTPCERPCPSAGLRGMQTACRCSGRCRCSGCPVGAPARPPAARPPVPLPLRPPPPWERCARLPRTRRC